MKRLLIAVTMVLFAAPLFAKLSKYKGWENSPQGYFMTQAEKDQWSKVDTDADAEKFIADFVAKRPANFAKEVADRAANADKYLTVAKVQGSKSLRGKVVILLGAPTQMDVAEKAVNNSTKRDNPFVAAAMSNMNSGGADGADGSGSLGGTISTSVGLRIMHFNYQGPVAKAADRKQIDVNVEVDPNTGKDRIASRNEAADLDSIFELVAQSWIRK
jgi:GWxTD domain-containing protein